MTNKGKMKVDVVGPLDIDTQARMDITAVDIIDMDSGVEIDADAPIINLN
jgi:hypothetical protein